MAPAAPPRGCGPCSPPPGGWVSGPNAPPPATPPPATLGGDPGGPRARPSSSYGAPTRMGASAPARGARCLPSQARQAWVRGTHGGHTSVGSGSDAGAYLWLTGHRVSSKRVSISRNFVVAVPSGQVSKVTRGTKDSPFSHRLTAPWFVDDASTSHSIAGPAGVHRPRGLTL